MSASTSSTAGNKLSQEKSPYLLQHANNPVHWYPWGREAFEAAKSQDRLIFLSVGYSTCHWCHVMEKESFESQAVADIMNAHFVNVKVDREERPDVDKVYMTFVQATSGGGGWPMSVFLTPDLEPIFGGTYFPPEDGYGRPGFKTLLRAIADKWEGGDESRAAVVRSGKKILGALREAAKQEAQGSSVPSADSAPMQCFTQLLRRYDPEMGGFSNAPKFPTPVNLEFLFALHARGDRKADKNKQALRMCLNTLRTMAKGGIFDHVSRGFARYSTDDRWHVPHFEKMLYDQAQLAVVYSQAFRATKEGEFKVVIEHIMEYVLRDLKHPLGGFFSAEDADSLPTSSSSAKKEGAFCVWTKQELDGLLPKVPVKEGSGKTKAELFCKLFAVKDGGNVNPRGDPHGELKNQNVLTRIGVDAKKVAEDFGISPEQAEEIVEECRKILYDARQGRPRPHLDDKIITSWNGLMISGLCAAGGALHRQDYIDAAVAAADFIRANLFLEDKGVLLRSVYTIRKGDQLTVGQISAPIEGFADDYAYLVRGLIDLYEATFDTKWLEWAVKLQDKMDDLFWDEAGGGYFTSASNDGSIVLRLKEDQDGAEPTANSVAASNLLRLMALVGKEGAKEKAELIFKAFNERLEKIPLAIPAMVAALILYHDQPVQIIITGDKELKDPTAKAMVELVQGSLLPNKVLILADGDKDSIVYRGSDVLGGIKDDVAAGTAFVCKDFTCSAPVSSVEELANILKIKQ